MVDAPLPASEAEGATFRGLWRLLFAVAPAHARWVGVALGLSLISGAVGLIQPVYFGQVVDASLRGAGKDVGGSALVLCALFVALGVLRFGHDAFLVTLGERIARDLRLRFHQVLLDKDLAYFTHASIGEALTRAGSDVTRVSHLLHQLLSTFVQDVVVITVGTTLMFLTLPKLGLLAVAVVAPVMIATVRLSQRLNQAGQRGQEAEERAVDAFHEGLAGIETIRLFGREAYQLARYGRALAASYRAAVRLALVNVGFAEASQAVMSLTIVLLLWRAGVTVSSGEATLGTVTTFFLYLSATAGAVGRMTHALSEARLASVSAHRLIEAKAAQSERLPSVPTPRPEVFGLEGVTHRYPERETDALRGVSLSFRTGRTYAIVGASGAGKSTLFRVLSGLLSPSRGRVFVGSAPLTELDPRQIREHLGVVPQDTFLFRGSILENIRYGRLEASDAEVEAVAQTVGLRPLLAQLADGLHTELGERGLQLSGGQRQRIAIARALLRAPAFLLLDEATSALDGESDQAIREALRQIQQGERRPGVVLISHRLSAVQDVDEILVFDEGRLVESGSHTTLMAARGRYAHLALRSA